MCLYSSSKQHSINYGKEITNECSLNPLCIAITPTKKKRTSKKRMYKKKLLERKM